MLTHLAAHGTAKAHVFRTGGIKVYTADTGISPGCKLEDHIMFENCPEWVVGLCDGLARVFEFAAKNPVPAGLYAILLAAAPWLLRYGIPLLVHLFIWGFTRYREW